MADYDQSHTGDDGTDSLSNLPDPYDIPEWRRKKYVREYIDSNKYPKPNDPKDWQNFEAMMTHRPDYLEWLMKKLQRKPDWYNEGEERPDDQSPKFDVPTKPGKPSRWKGRLAENKGDTLSDAPTIFGVGPWEHSEGGTRYDEFNYGPLKSDRAPEIMPNRRNIPLGTLAPKRARYHSRYVGGDYPVTDDEWQQFENLMTGLERSRWREMRKRYKGQEDPDHPDTELEKFIGEMIPRWWQHRNYTPKKPKPGALQYLMKDMFPQAPAQPQPSVPPPTIDVKPPPPLGDIFK